MNYDSGSDVEQEVNPLIVAQVKCTRVMLCWQFSGRLLRMNCGSGSDVEQEVDPLMLTEVKYEQVR